MRHIIFTGLAIAGLLLSQSVIAQSPAFSPSGSDLITNQFTNNVGIGVSAPSLKLTVNGDIGYETSNQVRTIRGQTTDYLEIYSNYNNAPGVDNGGPGLFMFSNWHTTFSDPGSFSLRTTGTDHSKKAFEIMSHPSEEDYVPIFTINNNGNVGISTRPCPDDKFKVTIRGSINLLGLDDENTHDRSINGTASLGRLGVFAGNDLDDGAAVLLNGKEGFHDPGAVIFNATADNTGANVGAEKAFEFNTMEDGAATQRMVINKHGNIGMGKFPGNNDDFKLSIAGNLWADGSFRAKGDIELLGWDAGNTWPRYIKGSAPDGSLRVTVGTGLADGASILMNGRNSDNGGSETARGMITFIANADREDDNVEKAFDFVTFDGGSDYTSQMRIRKDGKVAIGSNVIYNAPEGYKLIVEQGILTEKIKVALRGTGNWSDYVFADDYKLLPLHEVEAYIKDNKHLPEIPSATDMVKDGLDVATMDAKLLQKVEELTLYIIEQNKRINNLEAKLNK